MILSAFNFVRSLLKYLFFFILLFSQFCLGFSHGDLERDIQILNHEGSSGITISRHWAKRTLWLSPKYIATEKPYLQEEVKLANTAYRWLLTNPKIFPEYKYPVFKVHRSFLRKEKRGMPLFPIRWLQGLGYRYLSLKTSDAQNLSLFEITNKFSKINYLTASTGETYSNGQLCHESFSARADMSKNTITINTLKMNSAYLFNEFFFYLHEALQVIGIDDYSYQVSASLLWFFEKINEWEAENHIISHKSDLPKEILNSPILYPLKNIQKKKESIKRLVTDESTCQQSKTKRIHLAGITTGGDAGDWRSLLMKSILLHKSKAWFDQKTRSYSYESLVHKLHKLVIHPHTKAVIIMYDETEVLFDRVKYNNSERLRVRFSTPILQAHPYMLNYISEKIFSTLSTQLETNTNE